MSIKNHDGKKVRGKILKQISQFYQEEFPKQTRVLGKDYIPTSGRVFDEKDIMSLVDASLDFWLTEGRFNKQFENDLAKFCNVRFAITANSGSSANLLAFYSLTSHLLKDRAIKKEDEVIPAPKYEGKTPVGKGHIQGRQS